MTNISRAILLSFTFIKQQEQGDSEKKEGKDIKFGPRILILVPTRELAAQVAAQARQLRAVSGLATACLYGGVPKESQVELLQKNPQIIVATCGRLLDLVDDNLLSLSLVEYLVLDEADKMLGLGFKAQLDRLQGMLLPGNGKVERAQVVERAKGQKAANKGGEGGGSKRPQVLLFTATMPESVDEAAGHWLREPVGITVSHSADSISRTITQVVHVCAEHKKPAKLLKHLLSIKETGSNLRNPHRVLVFCNRIKTVRYLHDLISKEGLRCTMLHGQRSQQEREAAVLGFKAGKVQVLVATDVAARGLDIRRLPYVVSYDFPSNLETYIHRVGRTGRLSANGHSFSFFTRNLAKLAGPLMTLLQEHGQTIDPNLQQLAVAWSEAVKKAGDEGLLQAPVKEEGEGEGEGEELEEEGWEEGRMALDIDEGLISKDVIKRTSNEKPPAVARKEKPIVSHPASLAAPAPPAEEAFVPSSKFQGSKQGYLFKMGASGLGYYRDQQEMKKNSRSSIPKNQASEPKQMATNRSNDPIIGSGKKRKNWDSDSEDDFGPLTGARGKGKKSLPGRLRKKLKAK